MPKEYKILGIIAIAAILIGGAFFYFGSQTPAAKPLIDRADAYKRGNSQARVRLTEFADFQCPACRSAQPTVEKILQEYPQDVQLVFRHFPLSGHPLARIGAEAAEAAGAQGKFWEMYAQLYGNQSEWGDLTKNYTELQAVEIFKRYAATLGLDLNRFSQDISSGKFQAIISSDSSDGSASGVNATPQFFVNSVMIPDPSYASIKKGIDDALAKK